MFRKYYDVDSLHIRKVLI